MHKPTKTIGIFTVELDDAYQAAIWRGIQTQAEQLNLGAVTFLGSRFDSPIVPEATANFAYHLAASQNIDGLIIISSAIATFHDSNDLEELSGQWRSVLSVEIGIRIPGMSSITTEGSRGTATLTRHLIEMHNRRHFALITGPKGHFESSDRADACLATISEYGIHVDERLIVAGTFLQESGVQAAEKLLAAGIPFDALVCLNDRMAQGALQVLVQRGYRIPEDIALVGFDGSEPSKYTTPPLTTVVQPLYEMGTSAMQLIDRIIRDGKQRHKVLNCSPVIRESCGCMPQLGYTPQLTQIPAYASSQEIKAISDLRTLAHSAKIDTFIARLNTALDATGAESGAMDRWNEYISVIEHQLYSTSPDTRPAALFASARVLIGEKMGRYQAARRIATENTFSKLRLISSLLAGAFGLSSMFSRLEKGLSLFGIRTGFLVTFETKSPLSDARVLLAMDRKRFPIPDEGIVFNARELLPPEFGDDWKKERWVLTPLVYQNEQLGYLLLPGGFETPQLYDILQEQIASSLKGTLLLEQVRTHERILESEVALRTQDLQHMNEELSREVEQRAALEQEVIEVSNRTMERIGQDLHDDLCQHLSGITFWTSMVRNSIAANEQVDIASLDHINTLLTDSIVRVKQIARGLVPAGLEAQGLAWKVESLIMETIRSTGRNISFTTSDELAIPDTDTAVQIYRIIQEALSNALQHSEAKQISISLYDELEGDSPHMVAEIRDNGRGIPEDISANSLGLRIMRYRSGIAKAQLSITNTNPGTCIRCSVPVHSQGA